MRRNLISALVPFVGSYFLKCRQTLAMIVLDIGEQVAVPAFGEVLPVFLAAAGRKSRRGRRVVVMPLNLVVAVWVSARIEGTGTRQDTQTWTTGKHLVIMGTYRI